MSNIALFFKAEEVICPAMVNKPVITALHQAVNEKKAHDMMGAIMAGAPAENGAEHEERRDLGPKPPRPPPAKNGQTTPTKASVRPLLFYLQIILVAMREELSLITVRLMLGGASLLLWDFPSFLNASL